MKPFPKGFVLGAATAAFQVEGALAEDGRGESIWDRFCAIPGRVERQETAQVACDHYHLWPTDVALMRELGLRAYRFSIAWPRWFPDGKTFNARGRDHYARLVDGLLEAGIEPWVTLYHWDLPQALEEQGGWPARVTAERFAEYADAVGRALGDRVRHFLTVNEPWCAAFCGYRWGSHAPGVRDEARAFAAAYHLILAHGLAYDALKAHAPSASVGLPHFAWHPVVLNRDRDYREWIENANAENNGIFLDPVLRGRYPERVLEKLGDEAPPVTPADLQQMRRCDFVGVQYYKDELLDLLNPPARFPFIEYTDTGWPVTPLGLCQYLGWLHRNYDAPRIVITENGAAFTDVLDTVGRVRDDRRKGYLISHLEQLLRAIDDGVRVEGYFAWSLLDNFEWASGYRSRFGLVFVDYASQKRYVKDSGWFFADVIRGHGLP
jgi:beta-glucosidase